MDVVGIANIVAAVAGFASIGVLVWIAAHGDPERHAEEEARAFYDRHGRWPDDPVR